MQPVGPSADASSILLADSPQPAIEPRTAAFLSVLYTLLYVLPLYLSRTTRPSPLLSRDSPTVIRARIRTVSLVTALLLCTTFYVIYSSAALPLPDILHLLGLWPINPYPILSSLLLTATLFLGPLFESGIACGEWRGWLRGDGVVETLSSWTGYRNLIAAPATEELVFRSALVPLHLLSLLPPSKTIFLTPLYFGIAHVHHCYEFWLTHPDTPLGPAIFRSLFQFTYTSVFGWFATFVFLRTASLPAVFLVHALCNWQGLPRLWGRLDADYPETSFGYRRMEGKSDGAESKIQPQPGWKWTVAYYILLFVGAYGFAKGLWVLTEHSEALVEFGAGKQ